MRAAEWAAAICSKAAELERLTEELGQVEPSIAEAMRPWVEIVAYCSRRIQREGAPDVLQHTGTRYGHAGKHAHHDHSRRAAAASIAGSSTPSPRC